MSPGHADNGRDYVYHCLNLNSPRPHTEDAPMTQEQIDRALKTKRYAVSVETAEQRTAERIKLERELCLRPDDDIEQED